MFRPTLMYSVVLFFLLQWPLATQFLYPAMNIGSLPVSDPSASITIRATGLTPEIASLVTVSIYGPNEKKRFITSKTFDARQMVKFEQLASGTYWLRYMPVSEADVRIFPRKSRVVINSAENAELEVRLE